MLPLSNIKMFKTIYSFLTKWKSLGKARNIKFRNEDINDMNTFTILCIYVSNSKC